MSYISHATQGGRLRAGSLGPSTPRVERLEGKRGSVQGSPLPVAWGWPGHPDVHRAQGPVMDPDSPSLLIPPYQRHMLLVVSNKIRVLPRVAPAHGRPHLALEWDVHAGRAPATAGASCRKMIHCRSQFFRVCDSKGKLLSFIVCYSSVRMEIPWPMETLHNKVES